MLTTLLIALLASPDFHRRSAATECLSACGDPLSMAIAEASATDPEVQMRLALAGSTYRGLRAHHLLRSLEGYPFIDANPSWSNAHGQACLAAARDELTGLGLPFGAAAGWPCYRLACRKWLESGGDVSLVGWMAVRTKSYLRMGSFEMPETPPAP